MPSSFHRIGILTVLFFTLGLSSCQRDTTPDFTDHYLLTQKVTVPGQGEVEMHALMRADVYQRNGRRDSLHITPVWFAMGDRHQHIDSSAPDDYMLEDEDFLTLLTWMFAGMRLHLDKEGNLDRIVPGDAAAHEQVLARVRNETGALNAQAMLLMDAQSPLLMTLPKNVSRGDQWQHRQTMPEGTDVEITTTVEDTDDEHVLLSLRTGKLAPSLEESVFPVAEGRLLMRRDGHYPVDMRLTILLFDEELSPARSTSTQPIELRMHLASTAFSRYGFHDHDAQAYAEWIEQALHERDYERPSLADVAAEQARLNTHPDALEAFRHSLNWSVEGDDILLDHDLLTVFDYHMPTVRLEGARLLDHDGQPLPLTTTLNRRFEGHLAESGLFGERIPLGSAASPLIFPDPRETRDLPATLDIIELDTRIGIHVPQPAVTLRRDATPDPRLLALHWEDDEIRLRIPARYMLQALPLTDDGDLLPMSTQFIPAWASDLPDGLARLLHAESAIVTLPDAPYDMIIRTKTPATRLLLHFYDTEWISSTLRIPAANSGTVRRYQPSEHGGGRLHSNEPPLPGDIDMTSFMDTLAPACLPEEHDCQQFMLAWPDSTPRHLAAMCRLSAVDEQGEPARYYGNPLGSRLEERNWENSDRLMLTTEDGIIRYFHNIAATVHLHCPATVETVLRSPAEDNCISPEGPNGLRLSPSEECTSLSLDSLQALDDLGFALLPADSDDEKLLRFHGPIHEVRYLHPRGEITRTWQVTFPSLP